MKEGIEASRCDDKASPINTTHTIEEALTLLHQPPPLVLLPLVLLPLVLLPLVLLPLVLLLALAPTSCKVFPNLDLFATAWKRPCRTFEKTEPKCNRMRIRLGAHLPKRSTLVQSRAIRAVVRSDTCGGGGGGDDGGDNGDGGGDGDSNDAILLTTKP
jgi:hypothetical protein